MSASSQPSAELSADARHSPVSQEDPRARPGIRAARRSRLHGDVRGALILVAPLVVFMLVFFAIPIASLLSRSVWDSTVVSTFPQTVDALRQWEGKGLPAANAFEAIAHDVLAADDAGTLGDAAAQLNQAMPGMRILLMRTLRHLTDDNASGLSADVKLPAAPELQRDLIALDPRWGALATWQVLDRALSPITFGNVLRTVDLTQKPDGGIVAVAPSERVYLAVLGRTFWMSVVVTGIVALLSYPLAYWLNGLPPSRQRFAMMAVLVPFWTSILVRIAAWMVVLPRNGVVNRVLTSIHLIDTPLTLLYNRTGVYISMVHILIPFMVLPLFAVMRNIPRSHRLAAISLGSHPFGAFWRVYVPQTLPGVAAGAMLVFISALGYYIAPALLGGAGDQMISYYIAYFTNTVVNWGFAAALSVLLLAATAMLLVVFRMATGRGRSMIAEI